MGRPTDYTKELAEEICVRMIDGTSLNAVCKADDMPDKSTVFRWLSKHEEFRDKYAQAKEMSAEAWADEMFDIADNQCSNPVLIDGVPLKVNDKLVMQVDNASVAHARLRVDTRKWAMSKLLPKKYGDKQQHEHSGQLKISHEEWVQKLQE